MVTMHQVITFGLVALVLIAIPGPSVVFTIGRALTYGRSVALTTVVGNSLGLLAVLALVSLGLGDLVATSDAAFEVVKILGAVFLVYLGIQALRHRHGIDVATSEQAPAIRGIRALRQGFVVGFTNPKAYVIFAAVLPPFIDRGRGDATLQMVLLGLVAFGIGLCSDSLWALLASQLRRWFSTSPRRGRALGKVGGMSMIGLGLAVVVSGRPDAG
ncbi:MAG: LysE family translocator [Nocardioides sp.]|nr:LysE family translocator [Nocardioides sp.]